MAHFLTMLLSKDYIVWFITFTNDIKGVKTKITNRTVSLHKAMAVLGLVVCLVMIIFAFSAVVF